MNAMFLYFNNTVVKYTKTNPEITKPHSEEHILPDSWPFVVSRWYNLKEFLPSKGNLKKSPSLMVSGLVRMVQLYVHWLSQRSIGSFPLSYRNIHTIPLG